MKDKNKKTRKSIVVGASIFLVLLISFSVFLLMKNSTKSGNNLSSKDLLDKRFEMAFDPTADLSYAYITFSEENNSVDVIKRYKDLVTSEAEKIEKSKDERKEKGKVDTMETYNNLNIKISGDQYVISADGFSETFTRVDEKRIKDTNDVEYIMRNP
ncbi:hypothetical protein ACWN8V_05740 [Vagococcus elongatus]|uniref:Uncharacterized protein n=1 Tax=Vagococcus elongatus TaxID=180344 RepID=A0A430AXA0_9ENTE|nr:hypothetical protein [Vagococcus elongatus]RSU12656.1 hypothetical protein CBF29_05880 [Vagococcus elongatus]